MFLILTTALRKLHNSSAFHEKNISSSPSVLANIVGWLLSSTVDLTLRSVFIASSWNNSIVKFSIPNVFLTTLHYSKCSMADFCLKIGKTYKITFGNDCVILLSGPRSMNWFQLVTSFPFKAVSAKNEIFSNRHMVHMECAQILRRSVSLEPVKVRLF